MFRPPIFAELSEHAGEEETQEERRGEERRGEEGGLSTRLGKRGEETSGRVWQERSGDEATLR